MIKRNIKGLGAYLHLVKTDSLESMLVLQNLRGQSRIGIRKRIYEGKKEAGNLNIKENSE